MMTSEDQAFTEEYFDNKKTLDYIRVRLQNVSSSCLIELSVLLWYNAQWRRFDLVPRPYHVVRDTIDVKIIVQ